METTEKTKWAERLSAGRAVLLRLLIPGKNWFVRNFSGAAPGFCLVSSAAAGVVLGVSMADTYWPALPGGDAPLPGGL